MAKSAAWIAGFELAQSEFEIHVNSEPEYWNPYAQGTEQAEGYEEAVYTFTQK